MVADLDPVDALADLVDHPGGVLSDTGRQLDRMDRLHLAFPDPPVNGVHPCRTHGDAYLPGARVGLLNVDKVQNVRTAELVEAHSSHVPDHSTNGKL